MQMTAMRTTNTTDNVRTVPPVCSTCRGSGRIVDIPPVARVSTVRDLYVEGIGWRWVRCWMCGGAGGPPKPPDERVSERRVLAALNVQAVGGMRRAV